MLKTSLTFLLLALVCIGFADIEITTLDPSSELSRILWGLLTPDFLVLPLIAPAFLNTIIFALCGTFGGVVLGTLFAFGFDWAPVRLFCAFIRAIHEIFWAFIFLPAIGLNPICGVLAIAIPYAGIFAKVYAEILQEADQRHLAGFPAQTNRLSQFLYGVLPVIYEDVKNYTSYRFECALRSSAILGFIGLPTLGFHLETAFREGLYSEAAIELYLFYLLIASLKYWLKPKLVLYYVSAAFLLLAKNISFSWSNFTRFLTYDILPWPMRRDGFLNGTNEVAFPGKQVWEWLMEIFYSEALTGIWNTFVLTQIILAVTGIFTLVIFASVSHHFTKTLMRRFSKALLIIMRTTPEYILAYFFIQMWGPSMLPAIVTISLHNGAILAYLTGKNADLIKLRMDSPIKKLNRYSFEVLPRIYGQFLAFLFYRWEVMMRESAILGILGIYTLGFFIDSAIAENRSDRAIFLILITAILNILIDLISQIIRRRLKVSTKLVTAV